MANELIETLSLTIDGMDEDTFHPFRVHGVDEISQLFRFEIDAVSDNASLDEAQIFGRNATLEIGRQDDTMKVHGMISVLEQGMATERGQVAYRVVLTPRMERLASSRQNQIYGTTSEVTVVDVIRDELTADGIKGPGSTLAGRLASTDFEFRLNHTYPQRDYIVQHEESDLAFICRLAESQGIFFFFDHASGKDVVVFGDSRVAFSPSSEQASLRYVRSRGLVDFGENSIWEFSRTARPLPAKIVLRDYNYRLPHISLTAEAPVDPQGHGVVVEYGDHFRTPEEGNQLARIRAEEIKAHGVRFTGRSDCVALSAGHLFEMTDHYRSDFNARYVVTKITHTATMSVAGVSDLDGGVSETSYSNTFECLPSGMEFRPRRTTPKPVMAGLTTATVDAEGTGSRAELDDQGRYKIRQNFDLRNETDGKASQYVRKAEPYGGSDSGMHLPLLKDTEVVLACVNGDPNRPIIVGAVPNARNRSVITQKDQTSNRIRTTSGITFQMDDGPGSSAGSGAASGGTLAPQTVLEGGTGMLEPQRPAASGESSNDTRLFLNVTGGTDSDYDDDNYLRLGAKRSSGESDYVADFTSVADGILLYSPSDWNSLIKGSAYSRVDTDLRNAAKTVNHVSESSMGLAATALGITVSSTTPSLTTAPGETVSDGQFTITTSSDMNEDIGGDMNQTIAGTLTQTILGDSSSSTSGNAWDVTTGDDQEVFMGNAVSVTLGASEDFSLTTSLEVSIGVSVELGLSASIEASIGTSISYEGSISLLVNEGGKVGVKLGFEAEYNVLGAEATEVEAEETTVAVSEKTVEVAAATVSAKTPTVEAKTQSVSAETPAIKVVL